MKFKPVITRGIPGQVICSLDSDAFAAHLITSVCEECLGAKDPLSRPAEYYVQEADRSAYAGSFGVTANLTGVSRDGRSVKQFMNTLKVLEDKYAAAIANALTAAGKNVQVQLFCVIMLDAPIEISQGVYSNILESEVAIVNRNWNGRVTRATKI